MHSKAAGIEESQTASVSLIDAKTKAIVWAYNVKKGGSSNFHSSAEACAKHLKKAKTPFTFPNCAGYLRE